MNMLDWLKFSLTPLRDGLIGVIVVSSDAVERTDTPARCQALAEQFDAAGVVQTVVAAARPIDLPVAGLRQISLAGLAHALGDRRAVFAWSEQYHLSSEWIELLAREARARDRVVTHDGYKSGIVAHLGIAGNAIGAPAGAARRVAKLIAGGKIGAYSAAGDLAPAGIPSDVIAIDAKNILSLYGRAVRLDLPTSFVVETNSSCNYFCYMCPYHGGRQRDKPTFVAPRKYSNMDIALFKRVVDEIAAIERPYRSDAKALISPYRRGEILLYPQWREAINHLKSKPNIAVYFSSNGSLWSDEDVEFVLDAGIEQLQISIEGIDQVSHKLIRMNDEFEKVAHTIRRLMRRKAERGLSQPVLQLAHTVNERNIDDVDAYIEHWLDKADALFIGPENYADIELANKRYKTEFSPIPAPDRGLRVPCGMVKDNIWIDAEGTAILCIGSKQTIIGDVREQSMMEILASPIRMRVIDEHIRGAFESDVCRNCEQWFSAYGKSIETDRYSAFLSADTQYYRRRLPLDTNW